MKKYTLRFLLLCAGFCSNISALAGIYLSGGLSQQDIEDVDAVSSHQGYRVAIGYSLAPPGSIISTISEIGLRNWNSFTVDNKTFKIGKTLDLMGGLSLNFPVIGSIYAAAGVSRVNSEADVGSNSQTNYLTTIKAGVSHTILPFVSIFADYTTVLGGTPSLNNQGELNTNPSLNAWTAGILLTF